MPPVNNDTSAQSAANGTSTADQAAMERALAELVNAFMMPIALKTLAKSRELGKDT